MPFSALLPSQTISSISISYNMFLSSALNFRNSSPWSGFVKWSARFFVIGQCLRSTSSVAIRYLINKYRTCIWFVLFVIDLIPFVSSSIALRLSWYIIFSSMPYAYASMKYFFHGICGMTLSAPISLDSGELFFSFCLFDTLGTEPCPMEMVSPMCLSMSLWAA